MCFVKVRKYILYKRFRMKKSEIFRLRNFLKTNKVELHLLVIIFLSFFFLSNPVVQSRNPSTWHQVEARMQKYLSAT